MTLIYLQIYLELLFLSLSKVLQRLFQHIFDGLEVDYAPELAVIRTQYPSAPVRFTVYPLVIKWWDAIALLRESGQVVNDDYADLSSAQELVLGEIIAEKYKTDFYMIDQYPSNIRPFYTMPNIERPEYSNSYDLFLRGQEICSGAQRCHDPVCY